jgi:hypothetical protein
MKGKGDILSAHGEPYIMGDDYVFARGDVFAATGDILDQGCQLSYPYPSGEMQALRNMHQVAINDYADAKQVRDKNLRDWQECKAKLFCRAGAKEPRLNESEVVHDNALTELENIERQVNLAAEANRLEQERYDKCHAEELVQQGRQYEMDKMFAEQQPMLMASTAAQEEQQNKKTITYGLIGLGVLSVLTFSILAFK